MTDFRIERDEIDGVPVFWSDVEGPRIGALGFGVGRSHEPAPIGGISHLVEHLALAPLTQQAYSHNGTVTATTTTFHAVGSPEELQSFFEQTGRTLGHLPLDRLLIERRILRQESQDWSPSLAQWMLWYRFGTAGHGLSAIREFGLGWLGPDAVQDWASSRFTRGNAAIWFNGPPPAGLRLELPAGERVGNVASESIPGLDFPSHVAWNGPGVAIAWLASRSAATIVSLGVAARRARQLLRFERGVIYDVRTDYERLDDNSAHCLLAADCRPGDVQAVAGELLAILDELAAEGGSPEDISREVRPFTEMAFETPGRLGFLHGAVFDSLAGVPFEQPAAVVAEYADVDLAVVSRTLTDAKPTILVAASGPTPRDGLIPYPLEATSTVEGRTFVEPGLRFPGRGRKDRLTVGADGVTYVDPEGRRATVRYEDCAALLHFDGDIREIWGRDGFRVQVRPELWRAGKEAIGVIDSAIPPELIVCNEHGIGALEDPLDRPGASDAPTPQVSDREASPGA